MVQSTLMIPRRYAKVVQQGPPLSDYGGVNLSTATSVDHGLGKKRRSSSLTIAQCRSMKNRCFLCGEKGHRAISCRNAKVFFQCGAIGHISSTCSTRKKPPLLPPLLISEGTLPSMAQPSPNAQSCSLHRITLDDPDSQEIAKELS